jgi:hypothetical protein
VKKNSHARSRRSLRRSAARTASRQKVHAAQVNVRKPSAAPVPWDSCTDNCQFYLAAESCSDRETPGAIDPLAALDERFRKSAGWTKQGSTEPTLANNVLVGMRRPAGSS